MLSGGDGDERARLFGPIDRLVTIQIEGKKYQVPHQLELLRCFQYLEFHIAFENFCWNATCENCAANLSYAGKPAERMLCCQTPAEEGMSVEKLPEGVTPKKE